MDAALGKVLDQALKGAGSEAKPALKPQGESQFKELMQNQLQQTEASTKMVNEMFGPSKSGSHPFEVTSGESVSMEGSQFSQGKKMDVMGVLNDVNRSALQMDQMIEMVTSGQSFSPQELLAMQAGVYHSVMEVNLTGQIVSSADRARNSLLNIQI